MLIERKVYKVPEKYISKRWSKLEKRKHNKVKIGYSGWSLKPESRRFDKMCKSFSEAAEMAMNSVDISDEVESWIEELKTKLKKMSVGNKKTVVSSGEKSGEKCVPEVIISKPIAIHSPVAVRCKGRPPANRKKSTVEKVVTKRKRIAKTSDSVGEDITITVRVRVRKRII